MGMQQGRVAAQEPDQGRAGAGHANLQSAVILECGPPPFYG